MQVKKQVVFMLSCFGMKQGKMIYHVHLQVELYNNHGKILLLIKLQQQQGHVVLTLVLHLEFLILIMIKLFPMKILLMLLKIFLVLKLIHKKCNSTTKNYHNHSISRILIQL